MSRYKCVICGEVYWGEGKNAKPYKEGKCCDNCYLVYVKSYKKGEQDEKRERDTEG